MPSSIHSGVADPCPNPFNYAAYVLERADALADKVAVRVVGGSEPEQMTYGALKTAVLGTAAGLRDAGFDPGDRVLLRLGNTLDFPIAFLGCLAAGLVPVPTSAALPAHEVAQIVTTLSPRLIMRDPNIPSATGAPELGLFALRALRQTPGGTYQFGDAERLGYIIYTSGTSGVPTAVAHAHRAIWARRPMFSHWYDLHEDDVMLHAGAFNWTYTLGTGLMDPWTAGATALVPAPGTTPGQIPALLKDYKATLFAAAPGVYRQILNNGDMPPLPDLRHGLSAGEKMVPHVHKAWRRATGTRVYEAYGLSECSTFISASPTAPAKPSAIGRAQPGRKIAIIGRDGPVAAGTEGIIAVHRSDQGLMLSYVNAPDHTAAKFDGDWFLTGDLGVISDTGEVSYRGRADDMMNAGGFRVSPAEVEAVLADVPGITACGVAEIPLAPGKSIIAAFYTGPKTLDEDDLQAHAEQKLARYKQPRAYVHLPNLPLSLTGKLVRRRLPQFWPYPQSEYS